ncbi:MAG: hypothetical protein Q7R95_08260 [bacterium]|nr:hypothetical protein [bacterium]
MKQSYFHLSLEERERFKTPNEMMEEVNKYKFRKYLKTLQIKTGGALQSRM